VSNTEHRDGARAGPGRPRTHEIVRRLDIGMSR